jgi:ATP-dependent Zn protease
LKWNWDAQSWKKSTKILLAIATVWPIIYLGIFMVGMFSMFLFLPFGAKSSSRTCGNVDLLQLDRKIKDGEIKQLTVRPREIVAIDRIGDCGFTVSVSNKSTRDEILDEAREVVNGKPRVEKIEEESAENAEESPFIIAGFVALFALHMLSMLLMLALMPIYIILAVKNGSLDQTMRIVWVVLFCTMGMVVNPVYWYLYIWKKRPGLPPANPIAPSVVDIPSVS